MAKKFIVGLTGGLGSGKTTAAHLFEELGAFVIDADAIAHEALLEGSTVYDALAKLFPDAKSKGGFDRKKIANVIFKNPAKKKEMEQIVHPYVFSRISEEIVAASEPVVIVEVPLLFETGFNKVCDLTVTVDAGRDQIEKRLLEKGYTQEQIAARRATQMPEEEKMKKADLVLDNSGTLDQTRREVEKIWKEIHSRLHKKGEH